MSAPRASLALGAGPLFRERRQPGFARAIALAFAVHALLIAVLFVGVRFQSSAPDTVTVELWEPQPAPRVAEPPPPPPKVEPKPEPAPPKVEPRPEPKVEKPEIVEKAAPKPKPKAEPKPAPKPKPKPEAKPKPPARDLEFEKRMREELAQEQASLREQQAREAAAREQLAARNRALADWEGKIRAKIRRNIRAFVVDQVAGNPQAIFEVALLPTGEVLTVKMGKSSGNKAYDDEVQRAILASSPLPKPERADLFQRNLELKFRPLDQQ